MADSHPSPPPPPPPPEYWCYHCDKRVSVESLSGDDVICVDCKFGFVESLPPPPSVSVSPPPIGDDVTSSSSVVDDVTLGSQFLHVLRLLSHVTSPSDDVTSTTTPPIDRRVAGDAGGDFIGDGDGDGDGDSDFLRIEIDGWDNDNDNDNDDDEEEEEDDDIRSVEIEGDDVEDDDDDVEEREEDVRRRRREMLRLRLRDFATRARSEGRHRILDWAEILMGLEDNSIEFRFEVPETDRYVGNPGDYVDGAEYEALLQNLAEAEGRRGAPPASKEAVQGLRLVEVRSEEESYNCAICKDGVSVGEVAKEMPCGHGYHGECIVPWLAARNSCPVCRFELPTDDPEYEEEKRKKGSGAGAGTSGGGDSSLVMP